MKNAIKLLLGWPLIFPFILMDLSDGLRKTFITLYDSKFQSFHPKKTDKIVYKEDLEYHEKLPYDTKGLLIVLAILPVWLIAYKVKEIVKTLKNILQRK